MLPGGELLLSHPGVQDVPLYPPQPPAPPLRVGVLLDGFGLEAWAHRALGEIEASGAGRIAAFIVNWEPSRPQPSAWRNLLAGRAHRTGELFWRYAVLDRRRNDGDRSPFASVELRPMLDGVPVLDVCPLRKGFVHRFRDEDVERIRRLELDVLLRFGFNILRGEILTAARLGVWSYHHGDHTRYRGGPAMFWEMRNGERLCGAILQRLTEALDDGQVLTRSWARRENSSSLARVRRKPYWKSAAFAARSLRRAHALGRLPAERRGNEEEPRGRLYRTPGNVEMARFLGAAALRSASGHLRSRLRPSQWFIAWRPRRPGRGFADSAGDLAGFRPIYPPRGEHYADPFPIEHDGRTWCFFERFRDGGRGRIECLRFGEDGEPSAPKPALEADCHLSYPFVFAWRGKVFMMPETGERGAVQIYEARRFPHDWGLHSELRFGRPVYDPTLVERNGRWFLFATVDECGGGSDDELFLFSAPSPLGPWQPHPLNPVVSDARAARPAGRLFVSGGRLIRPAQDCSDGYGGAIALREVHTLTEQEFGERPIGRIAPDWHPGLIACHTVNAAGGVEVIDGRRVTGWLPG